MVKVRSFQNSFVSGELSPEMFGRIDVDTYYNGAAQLRNVYVTPQGGAFRREGLKYIDEPGTSADTVTRLVPFEFNDDQVYLFAFSAARLEIYSNDASVTSITSSPISNITEAMLPDLNFAQSADTMIVVHKDLQPIEITRTGATTFAATSLTLSNIPVFSYTGTSSSNPAATLTPSATTGEITLTAGSSVFTSGHVNQLINFDDGGQVLITGYTSGTVVTGYVTIELTGTSAVSSGNWALETGYEPVISSTRGWPRSVTFFGSRLWFGGLKERPQTLLASRVGDFFNLRTGQGLDDDGINVTINDDRVNTIYNIFPGRSLQVFTSGGEFYIKGALGDPITPAKIATQLQKATLHGSGPCRPVSVDGATIFVESGPTIGSNGYVVRQFIFNEVEDSFNAPNISILSSHLIKQPSAMAVRRATQEFPADYVYMVNSDGTLAVLSTLREQDLLAWSLFTTDGTFEDVVTVGRDVYVLVRREINGSDTRYIEKLDPEYLLDASLRQTSGSATTSWTGLSHLDGETVSVLGDEYVLENEKVSSGEITSSEAVSTLEAGLPFYVTIKTMPLDPPINQNRFSGLYKRLVSTHLRLYETRSVQVKTSKNTYEPAFRTFGDSVLDEPISLFTGWKKVRLAGFARDSQVTITQNTPTELKVLSMSVELGI